MLGNKLDYTSPEDTVSRNHGQELADSHNIKFIETSAITGEGIHEAFEIIVREIIEDIEKG